LHAAPSVLIVYNLKNPKDSIAAGQICEQLSKKYTDQGFSFKLYWNPYHFLEEGGEHEGIKEERLKALSESRYIVMLFSRSFIEEYKQQAAWRLAVERDPGFDRGIIIPICMESCDAPAFPTIPTFPKLPDLYTLQHGVPMSDDISERLCEIFDKALAKSNPTATALLTLPTPSASIPTPPASIPASPAFTPASLAPLAFTGPYFEEPHYPDDRFFNAPIPSPFFVGQRGLAHIEQAYRQAQSARPGSPNIFVLAGLRGSGKTQLAVEYAYRAFTNKLYRDVLWVDGGTGLTGSRVQLDEKVKTLLQRLRQDGKLENDQDAESLKTWLQKNQNWLLVFDEVDDVSYILDYLPSRGNGHVLVTTCNQIVGIREMHVLERMDEQDAILFLLKRTRKGEYKSSDEVPQEDKRHAEMIVQAMHCFPLAIDQAGDFIDAAQSDLNSYVKNYLTGRQTSLIELLSERVGIDRYHPLSLVECWQDHFRLLQKTHPLAADILLFCAFFNPRGTYHKIIIGWQSMFGPQNATLPRPSLAGLVIQLRRYSFIERSSPGNEMLSVHPFLPLILLNQLTQQQQYGLAQRAIQVVHMACFHYPDDEPDAGERQRWVAQITVCETLIDQWQLWKLAHLTEIIQQLKERKKKWQ
jgi:NB-ARC domain